MNNPLILAGVPFGRVWGASGVQGFDGEGYWYHRPLAPFGLSFRGMTFVSKTVTRHRNVGNTPLFKDGMTLREWRPRAIFATPRSIWYGTASNKIGLSNFGLEFYLKHGLWRERTEPFFISLMCLSLDVHGRLAEWAEMMELIRRYRPEFKAPFGFQKNESCPNVDHDPSTSVDEIHRAAEITYNRLGLPFVPKFALTMPPQVVIDIMKHPHIHGACVSNTIPWPKLPEDERLKYFGTIVSPLEKIGTAAGGGGISGAPLLHRLLAWKCEADNLGLNKPINGCGGILSPATGLQVAGIFDSIAFASMSFARFWRCQSTINQVNAYYEGVK